VSRSAASAPSADIPSMPRKQLVLMVSALVLSVASFGLNASMVSPAIRDINTELGPGAFVAMSTYFYLAGAIANVVLIRWSDYIGRKRVLVAILVVLVVGTVLTILASKLPVFVLGRALQGCSNVTFGLAFLIMRERLSGPTFGICCGVMSSINGGVAGGDALLGGVMVDRFGYRSIFMLILVVSVVALVFAVKAVPADEPGHRSSGRMDWLGAFLISMTVGGINLFFGSGGHGGWTSRTALAWVAVVSLVALIATESRVAHPLVAMKHMRTRQAWPLIVVTILVMGSFMVVLGFIVPAMAEDPDSGFGRSATMTALLFITPSAVVQVLTAPMVGRIAVRIGFVAMLRAGILAAVGVTALLAFFAQQERLVTAVMILFGLAFSMLMTSMSSLGVLQASNEEPGALPGISNACYGIGSSLGFAWAGPIVGSGTHSSFQHAIWICVGIGILALVFSLILKPKPGSIRAAPAAATTP
jgi:predicted MFS family arabinose efflux permease